MVISIVFLFIDESGDLGFSKRSGRWFVFTMVISKNKRILEKVVDKTRRGLRKKHRNVFELHAYHANEATRKRLLRKISELKDVQICCVILNKNKVYVDLREQKNYLYNYVANILLDRLHNSELLNEAEHPDICFDRKDTKKSLRDNFVRYLEQNLSHKRSSTFKITIHSSHREKALQAVDFISWSIFRKYEQGDFEYYGIFADKIIEENVLFP